MGSTYLRQHPACMWLVETALWGCHHLKLLRPDILCSFLLSTVHITLAGQQAAPIVLRCTPHSRARLLC
jgi:hypothetical protein